MSALDTLTLARRYNLVETIYASGARKKDEVNEPPLKLSFLTVIDFESTCWETRESSGKRYPEIIEFPAVLLDLKNGEVLDEFHHYVMPLENTKLSDFCKKFTGISQQQVDNSPPLKTCLLLFKKWTENVSATHGMKLGLNCALATWSDWDLGTCLEGECARKHIQKPEIFNRWIDLRAIYKECYERRPQGLKGALKELAIPFLGREHSGIWDARNTAKLAYKIVQDGFQLKITKDLNKQKII